MHYYFTTTGLRLALESRKASSYINTHDKWAGKKSPSHEDDLALLMDHTNKTQEKKKKTSSNDAY